MKTVMCIKGSQEKSFSFLVVVPDNNLLICQIVFASLLAHFITLPENVTVTRLWFERCIYWIFLWIKNLNKVDICAKICIPVSKKQQKNKHVSNNIKQIRKNRMWNWTIVTKNIHSRHFRVSQHIDSKWW